MRWGRLKRTVFIVSSRGIVRPCGRREDFLRVFLSHEEDGVSFFWSGSALRQVELNAGKLKRCGADIGRDWIWGGRCSRQEHGSGEMGSGARRVDVPHAKKRAWRRLHRRNSTEEIPAKR